MNIGIVTTWFERGAAYVSRQYRRVLEAEHDVFVYARSGESYAVGDPEWDDRRITWAKKQPFVMGTTVDLGDFRKWLLTNLIELVIFNEQVWWPPVVLCNEMGIKTATYIDYYTEATVPFFACYDCLLCNTLRHQSVFVWHPQCIFIPWGTEVEVFVPRTFEPVSPGSVTFFHSAGMSPGRKGTDLVIQAFQELDAPAKLVIHSQVDLQGAFPHLRAVVGELLSSGRLIVRHETVPAPGLYSLGDVYVYPTRLEGIGLTIAEALACGLPVITTDSPPMNEFIEPRINGLLVSVEKLIARADGYYWPQSIADVLSLREQMRFYLCRSSELPTFKRNARSFAEDKLDWHRNATSLPSRLRSISKLPEKELREAGREALAFERRRASLQQLYPTAFYMAHLAMKPLRTTKGILSKLIS